METHFLASEYPQTAPERALFHVIPVPLEATVSYGGGTARGPATIISASAQLERYDGFSCPGDLGIHTASAVDCTGTPAEILPRVGEAVALALQAHRGAPVPVVLGGEHSITAPAVEAVRNALRKKTGKPDPLGVVQIDAHADLRDQYEGSPLSHASVIRRVHQDLQVPVLQLGVRALCEEDAAYRQSASAPDQKRSLWWYDAREIVPTALTRFELPRDFPEYVYITLDVDGLDPSVCPATGTPVPGGIGWYQVLEIVQWIAAARSVSAFDVVELAPIAGLHAPDYAIAELTYRIMGMIARSRVLQSENDT